MQSAKLTQAEKQASQYRQSIDKHRQAAQNTHQSQARREHATHKQYETEAKLHLLEKEITTLRQLRGNLAQPAENFEAEYIDRTNETQSFVHQEAQYLRQLAILEAEHQRTISSAIHFREFAEKAKAHTPERAKRTELAEYWEKRADNIERHIDKHLLTAPEPPGDENSQEGGVPPNPPWTSRHNGYTRPGNHFPGPRTKTRQQKAPDRG